jgi:hypothetical protein
MLFLFLLNNQMLFILPNHVFTSVFLLEFLILMGIANQNHRKIMGLNNVPTFPNKGEPTPTLIPSPS